MKKKHQDGWGRPRVTQSKFERGPDKRWKILMTGRKKKAPNVAGDLIGGETEYQTERAVEKKEKKTLWRWKMDWCETCVCVCVCVKAQSTCKVWLTDSLMIGT